MTQDANPSIGAVWSNNPGATAVALAVGALIAAGLILGAIALGVGAGDEPPIRVKNNSIDLELLHKKRHWKEVGDDGKQWKISKGKKNADLFELFVAPTDPETCKGGLSKIGSPLVFTYSDGTVITITSDEKKTMLSSTQPMIRNDENNKLLSYDPTGTGFIKTISVGGTELCKFEDKDHKLGAAILEPGS